MAFNLIKGFINTASLIRTEIKEAKKERQEKWEAKFQPEKNNEYGLDLFVKSSETTEKTENNTSKCNCNCNNKQDVSNDIVNEQIKEDEIKEETPKKESIFDKVINFLDENDDGKVTIGDFKEKITNKIQKKKQTSEMILDTGKTVIDALKFTSTNTDIHVKELLEIYTKDFTRPLSKLAVTMIKHNMEDGAYFDLSNIVDDVKDIYKETLATEEDTTAFIEGIQKHANFATSKEYKKYLAEEDNLTKTADGIKTAQTCLNVCDYMNMGTTAGVTYLDKGWTCVSDGDPSEKNAETGFWGKAYVNEESKQLIIGFSATNSISDWGTDDVQMVKGEVPEQYDDALAFYNKYANDEKYKDYEVVVTGHSMGGSLGQLVGSTEGVNVDKVIAFNPFGTYEIQNNKNDSYEFVNNNDKIYNYINEYDIVSCSARHVGQTTLLNSISMTIVGNHLIDSMHHYLNEKRDEIC